MIQVLGKAFDIIELLAKDPERTLSLSEIANTFGLNHGTCANIIKTLVERNYVEKLPEKKGYKLGLMAFKLAGEKDYYSRLINAARPEMEKLTNLFNENSLLTVLHGNQRVAILRINSHNQLQAVTPTEKEAYNSSTGKLLIAFLGAAELETFIKKYGLPRNKTTKKEISKTQFLSEINKIRVDAFATHLPEDEILGLAVPVFQKEKVVASLSLYMPSSRSSKMVQKKMLQELKAAAQRVGAELSL